MRLHILGSGCPQPTPEHYGSAFILEVGPEMFLVDCGPAATYKMACMGIRPLQIGRVFLTHLHFDHNVDLPCFALTRWDASRGTEPPLEVYGPPPTQSFVARLLGEEGAFYEDWKSRIEHRASHECHRQRQGIMPRPAPAVVAKDVGPGAVTQGEVWSVTAERVHHVEPWLESLAYHFETEEGSVLFAGDCADCQALRDFARGVDTLVMACTHFGCAHSSPAIIDVITGTPGAAAIAAEAGVKRLVLTHVSPNFSRPGVKERAVSEVARAWGGMIYFPGEMETVDLG